MRRLIPFALVLAALASAGCGGGRAVVKKPALPQADADAIRARAEAQQDDLDRAAGIAVAVKPDAGTAVAPKTGTAAPEAPERRELESRKGQILGTDPEGCTWVVGESTIVAGDQDSPSQARASAIEQARAAAVQDFLGVDVNSKSMDFQQEGLRHDARLIESLLQTTRNGRIIKEKLVERGYKDGPDCSSCRYHVRLEACVLPLAGDRDKDFRVELQLSNVRFRQGDEAKLTITATRDCSLYIYDVFDLAADNKTALVVPNDAVPSKVLKAGETWEYPDEDAKKRGVRLVAELPNKADDVSAETIIVVATKTPLPTRAFDPTDGGYLGVLRRLHHSKIEWAEDAAAYTIYNH
jgi:hypothetical protein